MSNERNINLKHLLDGIGELRHHADEIYKSLKAQLGEEATFIKEWYDLKRVQMDDPDATELEGDTLLPDILVHCFQKKADYIWHYNGLRIRLTPFRSTNGDSGFIMYYGDCKSEVTFNSVVETIVEYGESVWDATAARIYGIADGYLAGLNHKVHADMPSPDADAEDLMWKRAFENAVAIKDPDEEPDLKWKDGYDNATAVKVPEGADNGTAWNRPMEEEEFDGCLREAVAQAEAEEPVIDQAVEPVAVQEEKVSKPKKNIIKAGGGPLPDGNVDMTDEQKEEYRRWKESQEDF